MSDPKKNYCAPSRNAPNTHPNQHTKCSSRPSSPQSPCAKRQSSPQRQMSPQRQSHAPRQSNPCRQPSPQRQSTTSNRPIVARGNLSRKSSPVRKISSGKIQPKVNCPKIDPCGRASPAPDLDDPMKNVKFISRNDILVYVDNENNNQEPLEKQFTIITTTEEEWVILKKLFQTKKSNYENSKDVKYHAHRKYDDADDDENDYEDHNNNDGDNCNASESNDNDNNDCDSNDQSSQRCDESLNTVIENELNSIHNIQPAKLQKCNEHKTCYYCSKDFITKNRLLVSGKCLEIKMKDCSNKCNTIPPVCIENIKRTNSLTTRCVKETEPHKPRRPVPEIKKPLLITKCTFEDKPKACANLGKRSCSCVQKPKNVNCNATFGAKRKTSLVPPDHPERPVYFAYKPRTFGLSRSLSNDNSFTCNNPRSMPPCNRKNETSYQRDFGHQPKTNSATSGINYNNESFNYNQFQYPEYCHAQRNIVTRRGPIRVNAVNIRSYADPYYQSIPTVPFTVPYM